MKRSSFKNALAYIIPILLFGVMLVWFISAINNTDDSTRQRELAAVKSTIENGITMCYAIEGAYPESVDYLAENYGLNYDNDRYIVRYDRFADNIRPTVIVIERQAAK